MLHSMLSRVAQEFSFHRTQSFAGNEFGNFVRHDIAVEAKKRLIFLPYELKVKSSVGAGNWASVPWLAFFDPLITESATSGFYVVYLVNPQTEEVYLSLNQGTTSIYREFGERRGREVLKRRAIDMADRISEYQVVFDTSPIKLSSTESLPLGYQAGHVFGKKYKAGAIDGPSFESDLEQMLSAYELLVNRGGTTPTETMFDEAGSNDVVETRRYILSKRIERAPRVRKRVLEKRGIICEGCGLNPVQHLGHDGSFAKLPLEVHHTSPIHGLAEGESKRYKVPIDFLVLCPTCHTLIHQQSDPSDLQKLQARIHYKLVQKTK